MLPSYPFVKRVFMEKQFLFCNVEMVWKKASPDKGRDWTRFSFLVISDTFIRSPKAVLVSPQCTCCQRGWSLLLLFFTSLQRKEFAWKSNLTSLFCKITEKWSRAAGNQSKTAFGTGKWKARYVWEDASALKSDEHREWKEHR